MAEFIERNRGKILLFYVYKFNFPLEYFMLFDMYDMLRNLVLFWPKKEGYYFD